MVMVASRYDYVKRPDVAVKFDVVKGDDGVVTNPEVVSRTSQSERKHADINFIVAKAKKTGVLASGGVLNGRQPSYGDFSSGDDFEQMQLKVARFKSDFELLPSELRNKFENRAELLLDFVLNPENKEKAIEMGLLPKPKIEHKFEGEFKVTYKDGKEIGRVEIPKAPPEGGSPEGGAPAGS
jgi:hypothetical protein